MSFKHISVADTQALLGNDDVVVADIRDENTFAQGHIPGAEHLSNANLAHFMQEKSLTNLLLWCVITGSPHKALLTT